MSELPGISGLKPQKPIFVDDIAAKSKVMSPHVGKGKEVMSNVISLILAESPHGFIKVTNPQDSAMVGKPTGATGVPTLDTPENPSGNVGDLAKLIAKLKQECDTLMSELAKQRIENSKSDLETRHQAQIKKLLESFEAMEKAAKMAVVNKALGWIGAAMAVLIACVDRTGLSIGLAAAAITFATLGSTGVMEKLTEAIAKSLKENQGHSEDTAAILAAVVTAVIQLAAMAAAGGVGYGIGKLAEAAAKAAATAGTIAATQTAVNVSAATGQATEQTVVATVTTGASAGASGGSGVGSTGAAAGSGVGSAVKNSAETTVKFAGSMMSLMSGMLQLVTGVLQGVSTAAQYKSTMLQADLTEIEKFMAILRQHLDEAQEELQESLTLVQNNIKTLVAIITSKTNVELEIARQMGRMA